MSKRANRRTEIVIDESGNITIRRGGTLTGEPMVEPELEPEPESEPELATWQLCVRIEPEEVADAVFSVAWYRSDNIPEDWYSVVPYTQPVETVKKLPEGQKP